MSMLRSALAAAVISLATVAVAAGPPASPRALRIPPFSDLRLPNGTRLLLMEKHDVPLVAFTALLRGGSVADPVNREGTASITASLLLKGAGSRDAIQFAETVANVGGTFTADAQRESIALRGEFLAADARLMIELLGDTLRRPTFSPSEFEKVRDRSVQEIAATKDSDPSGLVGTYFSAFLFGSHPYGKPIRGSETSLAAVTRDDVMAYHRANFGADRLILAVVGDFNSRSMESLIRRALDGWKRAATPLPPVAAFSPPAGRRVLLIDKPDATQTYFWIGNLSVPRADPAIPAITLSDSVFGGSFTSLLNNELRVKSGLTYGAGWRSIMNTAAGPGAISSYTRTESTTTAIDLALDVLAKYRRDGMTPEMLTSAKHFVLGQFPAEIETGGQLAERLASMAFYGLPKDEVLQLTSGIESATASDIGKVIGRVYPDPANLTFVLIGNAAAIRDSVRKYGPLTEMKITDKSFAPK